MESLDLAKDESKICSIGKSKSKSDVEETSTFLETLKICKLKLDEYNIYQLSKLQ